MNAGDIPSETDIAALDLGALVSLRRMLTAMVGTAAATYLTTYEEILADTLALAALLTGRARQPPPPAWIAQIDNQTGTTSLDDPAVEARILQLLDKTDHEIYQIITQEFTFSD